MSDAAQNVYEKEQESIFAMITKLKEGKTFCKIAVINLDPENS